MGIDNTSRTEASTLCPPHLLAQVPANPKENKTDRDGSAEA
jgi:hypothetical protein